jgi:hypothetical protein
MIAKKLRAAQLKRVRDDNAVNINGAEIIGAPSTHHEYFKNLY